MGSQFSIAPVQAQISFSEFSLPKAIQKAMGKAPIAQASPSPSCCRYCSTGKACGSSCISKQETCNQPSGCACDGERPAPFEYEGDFESSFPASPIPLEDELPDEMKNPVPPVQNSPDTSGSQSKSLKAHPKLPFLAFLNLNLYEKLKLTQSLPKPFKCSVPVTATPVPKREVVVDRRNITIELYDADKEDRDVVSLYTDNLSYIPTTLTKTGIKYTIDLGDKPGNRTIGVQNVNSGALSDQLRRPIVTPGIAISETDLVASSIGSVLGGKLRISVALQIGQRAEFKIGFPRIYVRNSAHPQSACHIAEAWRVPPIAMEKPMAGKPGNPLRSSYPRVLTIASKATATSNRSKSVKNYTCANYQNGRLEQRDEYPQATYTENNGSAHIKCINASDNEGSGGSIGRQMEKYGPRKVKLLPGNTIEMVLGN